MRPILKYRALKDDMSDCRYVYGQIYYYQGIPRIWKEDDTMLFTTCIPGTEEMNTGIVDAVNNEIYENDRVLFTARSTDYLPCMGYSSDYHRKGAILTVRWYRCGFMLVPDNNLLSDIPSLVGNVNQYDFYNHHNSFIVIGSQRTISEINTK